MFEDIIGKDKKYVKTNTWILYIDNEEHNVEVFNTATNKAGQLEGYIKDKALEAHYVDDYTNYMLKAPGQALLIKVLLLRVNKDTVKFYVPEVK